MLRKIKEVIEDISFEIKHNISFYRNKFKHFLDKINLSTYCYKNFYYLKNVDLNGAIIYFAYSELKYQIEFIKENYAPENFPKDFYKDTDYILKLMNLYIKDYLINEAPYDSMEKAESFFKREYPFCFEIEKKKIGDSRIYKLNFIDTCDEETSKIKEKMNKWMLMYEKEKFRRKYEIEKEIFNYFSKYGKYLEI